MRIKNYRAQSTLEYALMIAAIVGGLVLMQSYINQAFQGKLKANADRLGKQFDGSGTYSSATRQQSDGNSTTVTIATTIKASTANKGETITISAKGETLTASEEEEWGTKPSAFPTFKGTQ